MAQCARVLSASMKPSLVDLNDTFRDDGAVQKQYKINNFFLLLLFGLLFINELRCIPIVSSVILFTLI